VLRESPTPRLWGAPLRPRQHLHVLRGNLGKADASITVAEDLIEQCWDGSGDAGDDDNNVTRRRNQVAHLVESAKLAVRAAAYAGEDLANRRQGA
jgi:hypothetical protein